MINDLVGNKKIYNYGNIEEEKSYEDEKPMGTVQYTYYYKK